MLSRVVPATGLVITRSSWASALTNVLLPTLRRPTIASFISGSSADSRIVRLGRRQQRQDRVLEQPRGCGAGGRSTDERLAEAERGEVGRRGVEARGVGLVGHQDHRRPGPTDAAGHLLIGRHQAGPDIDHKQDRRRGGQAALDLGVDLGRQPVGVVEAHAAGVDQIDHAAVEFDPLHEPVAGDARGRILDGDPLLDSQLKRLDLPTLGRPTMTTWGIMAAVGLRPEMRTPRPSHRPAAAAAWHGQGSGG